MPLIIDADVVTLVIPSPAGGDFEPVWRSLMGGKSKAVYGGKLKEEYEQVTRLRRLLLELSRRGSLVRFSDQSLNSETETVINERQCVSNDYHIIALARVAKARLLCSHDTDLHIDFKNRAVLSPAGHVYQNRAHIHLISRYGM